MLLFEFFLDYVGCSVVHLVVLDIAKDSLLVGLFGLIVVRIFYLLRGKCDSVLSVLFIFMTRRQMRHFYWGDCNLGILLIGNQVSITTQAKCFALGIVPLKVANVSSPFVAEYEEALGILISFELGVVLSLLPWHADIILKLFCNLFVKSIREVRSFKNCTYCPITE